MSSKFKKLILALTLFLALIVVLQSQINILGRENPINKKFEVTQNPLDVFNDAREKNQLIFLEFYASW